MIAEQTSIPMVRGFTPLGVAVFSLFASAGSVAAQEGGGLNATFDVTQRFEQRQEEGFVGGDTTDFRSLTALAFGLSSETRSQRLDIGASTGLAVILDDGDNDVTFEDNSALLDYARSNRDSALSFGVLYRRDEVDDLVFDSTLADDDIVTGEGEREVLTVNSGLVLGREARVTGTFNHTYETSQFFETLDTSLSDTETQSFDARISMQLTRTLTVDVFGIWDETDEQGAGATDRDTVQIGTSASYAINPITTVTGEIAYIEEESRSTTTVATDGVNFGLSVTRERQDGVITLDYSQEEALTGTRRTVTAGQERTTRRGEFGYSLGVSETEGFDPQFLANLSLDYDLDRNGVITVALSQDGTINGDDEEVVNTRLNLSYARELTRVSRIDASFGLVDENILESGSADQRSFEFDVSYTYDLPQAWGLTTGYQYSSVRLDGTPDRDRTTLFVGVQKRFAYRP